MSQPRTLSPRRTPADLVDAVVDNMRQNIEELKYATLAPSRYLIYLSPDEYARLEGIIPRLQAETTRALDEELERLNRPSWLRRQLGLSKAHRAPLENAGPRWHVEFLCDTDHELQDEGDILVHSDLVLAPDPELGVGERTRRITTVRSGDQTSRSEQVTTSAAFGASMVHARLSYRDKTGDHQYDLVRDRITIGRGGLQFPVDIKLSTSDDVSREHARIRRDPATGRFYLIDLSSLGTTLDGRHVPRGVEDRDGVRQENGAETQLPARARIGLADTVFLDFEQCQ
ncbi:MAG TPA: FhaA domain-containing protein [Vicinamibacterales bacterium]|nr:FhaA domain-containing protein [Vicinamibacterales bacterium]